MSAAKVLSLTRLSLLVAIAVSLSGCISFDSDDSSSRGVKLSDAMHASASNDRSDLGGHSSGTYVDTSTDSSTATVSSGGGEPMGGSYNKHEYSWQILGDVNYEIPLNGDIRSLTRFSLTPVSLEGEKGFLGLYIGGAIVNYESGSLPDVATKNPWMLDAGLTYRHYFNGSRTGLSPYITAGLGYQLLGWDYRNPVISDGDAITRDLLQGFEGHIGLGVSTMRDCHWGFFGEVDLGGTTFLGDTYRGFENDVFDNFGFVCFKAGFSLRF